MPTSLKTTPLHSLHLELGAKMAPFAGYHMPLNYPTGIIAEHLHTRQKAGLFDVSHMGQMRLTGTGIGQELERLIPVDLLSLADGKQKYGFFTNERGGILDDLMITRLGDDFLLVVNAACKAQDLTHCQQYLDSSINIEMLEQRSLLALQGPHAVAVLQHLGYDLSRMGFMSVQQLSIRGMDCTVSRSGYSGEDGFEISIGADNAIDLACVLLEHDDVKMIGLGARDSLRLEAGLCLYGHDLTPETTPLEANLQWAIAKSRRPDGARPGGFIGEAVIFKQYLCGISKRRVGIKPEGRVPIREGAPLLGPNEQVIGHVTSGGFSPSLSSPIAMGYVEIDFTTLGTDLNAMVRNKKRSIQVVRLPFIKQNYYTSK